MLQRGHRVTVLTNSYFEELVRKQGLDFMSTGTRDEFLQTVNHPDLWDPLRGFDLIWGQGVVKNLPSLYHTIKEQTAEGNTVVAAASLAIAARIAQEKLRIPVATVHLQPCVFRSLIRPPILPPMPLPRWAPRWLIKLYYHATDRFVNKKIGVPFNTFRASLGLPPVFDILGNWWHSPQLTLGLFPAWFANPPGDWPASVKLTGFPLYDEADIQPLPDELEAFMNAGPAPVIFTPGSAMSQGSAFFEASAEACRILGCRALFITKFPAQLPRDLPAGVRHVTYVPFSRILPRAAAFVHHGGIGTTGQALAAGVPQLVMPFSFDQPDNAAYIEGLGLGRILPPSRYNSETASGMLKELMEDQVLKARCREIAEKFVGNQAVDETCDLLENLLTPKHP